MPIGGPLRFRTDLADTTNMALINITKKVAKAAGRLGIDERVEAACTTNPTGTMKVMLAKELSGLAGAAIASRGGSTGATATDTALAGMADAFPTGRCFLTLTEHRLLAISMSAMTGGPKTIVAEWHRTDVAALIVEKGALAAPLQIAFADGTAVVVEGAKGTDPGGLDRAFNGTSS